MLLSTTPKKLFIPLFIFFLFVTFLPSTSSAQASQEHSDSKGDDGHTHMEMPKQDPSVGLVEKIGASIPLDLTFKDEQGNPVTLGQLIDGPTIIAPVYYLCPNVCNFLQADLARVLPEIKRKPGEEYRVLSISFDETEKPEMAASFKDMYFKSMGGEFPAEGWRFLTGEKDAIKKLTDSAGLL